MELRRAGGYLWRLSSTRPQCLAPTRPWLATARVSIACQRKISTTAPRLTEVASNDAGQSPREDADDDLAALVDRSSASSTLRTSLFSPLNTPTANRSSPNSATDIAEAYRTSSRASRSRVPTDRMLSPKPSSTSLFNPRNRGPIGDVTQKPAPPPLRLGPNLGRSVAIDPTRGTDVGRGLAYLNIVCAQNKVKSDAMKQRFHERPGLKRKRLKSERWRRRFMLGFKGMVSRVRDMTKKGW